jgi:hypothetical protein
MGEMKDGKKEEIADGADSKQQRAETRAESRVQKVEMR